MIFRHMEVLSAIIQTGSITGAARLLNVSQPNVTRVLNHAEQQLGFVLFERRRKGLVPTPEARLLMPEIEAVMRQMATVDERVARIRRGEAQRLRVGSVPALAQSMVTEPLISVSNRYPDLIIELATLHFDTACERILNNQLDIAIVFSQKEPSWSKAEVIYNGHLVAVSPKEMRLETSRLTLYCLARNDMILIPGNDPLGELLNETLIKHSLRINGKFQIHTYSVLVDLVAAGAGVAVVDPFTAFRYRDHVNIASIEPEIPFSVAILHHINAPLSSAALYFLEILRSKAQTLALGALGGSSR